jgi:hypothetical protein
MPRRKFEDIIYFETQGRYLLEGNHSPTYSVSVTSSIGPGHFIHTLSFIKTSLDADTQGIRSPMMHDFTLHSFVFLILFL